jgi:hypothetical protein
MFKPSHLSGYDYEEFDYLGDPTNPDDDVDNDDDDDNAKPTSDDFALLKDAYNDPEIRALAKQGLGAAVSGASSRKTRKEALVQYAQSIGYPDAAEFPGFVLRAVKRSSRWRTRKAGKYSRIKSRCDRKQKNSNRCHKARVKLGILAIAEQLIQAEQQGKTQTQTQTQTTPTNFAPASNVQVPLTTEIPLVTDQTTNNETDKEDKENKENEEEGSNTWMYVGGAVGLLAVGAAVWYFTKGKR